MEPPVCVQVSAEIMTRFTFSLFIFAWGNCYLTYIRHDTDLPLTEFTGCTSLTHQNRSFCTMIHMSDSSDPPLYFRCSTPTWGLLYVTPIVRIRRWSSCWQLYRWFMKAAAKTGRVQNKPMIYSRESELRNWCFKKKVSFYDWPLNFFL